MTALIAQPGDTFAAWVLLACAVIWVLSDRLVAALCWIDERDLRRLAREAADHGEPSREQVEWDAHVADALRLAAEDHLARRSWDELQFAASVMADIDELPGGAA